MVEKERTCRMKKDITIDNIGSIPELTSELDLERAKALHSKLRWMSKDNPNLTEKRKYLGQLIQDYENKFWENDDEISDQQILESDLAEMMVEKENIFFNRRKDKIRDALKKLDLKQQDLADILEHRKNYMSELINGVRPFALTDLQIISKFLKIDLDALIPPFSDLAKAEKTVKQIQKTFDEKPSKKNDTQYSKEYFLIGDKELNGTVD